MAESLVALLLDEGKWLFCSMLASTLVVLARLPRRRETALPPRARILWAMNVFYGCVIGMMASGHLLAVTIRLGQGTLEGSWPFLYGLGLALAVPAWWLALRAGVYVTREDRFGTKMAGLNAWLGVCLLGLGFHNAPLAVPAALNLGYQFHRRRAIGWIILTVAAAANVALLVGSFLFFTSGQSFEQFMGIE